MKRSITAGVLLATVVGVVAIFAPAANGARARCPSSVTPPPGSTVTGGLEVDGACYLDDVTVIGTVVVDPSGGLQLSDNSSVGAGIVVNGGELDIDHELAGSGLIPGTSRVVGGITLNSPSDYDIETATILGGIKETGNTDDSAPTICGNTISGGIRITDSLNAGLFIGDPTDEPTFADFLCPGNTIGGGVTLTDVGASFSSNAVEGNTIRWAVRLDGTLSEVNGNKITGGVSCVNGGFVIPGEYPDPASNLCS